MVRKLLSISLVVCFGGFTIMTGCAGPTLSIGPRGNFSKVYEHLKDAYRNQQAVERLLGREGVREIFGRGGFRALNPDLQEFVISKTDAAIQNEEAAYAEALEICEMVLSSLEEQSGYYKWGIFWIAVVGSLAGAVLLPAFNTAPLENKALVSGLGGVTGVANTA